MAPSHEKLSRDELLTQLTEVQATGQEPAACVAAQPTLGQLRTGRAQVQGTHRPVWPPAGHAAALRTQPTLQPARA